MGPERRCAFLRGRAVSSISIAHAANQRWPVLLWGRMQRLQRSGRILLRVGICVFAVWWDLLQPLMLLAAHECVQAMLS